jgi:hypothetical protein
VTLDTTNRARHRRAMSSWFGAVRDGFSGLVIARVPEGALRPLSLSLLTALVAGLAACGDDEAFLPLDQLCPALAEDLCTARNAGCCPMVDPVSCEATERTRCEADKAPFESDASRRYDSRAAARQLQAVRTLLDACGAPPGVATFFGNGLPVGAACERESQCASGTCSGAPGVCTELMSEPLCRP